jgi:hypothetical protein
MRSPGPLSIQPEAPQQSRRAAAFAVVPVLITLFSIACDTEPATPQLTSGQLWQKGPYQTLYGADGRIERVLYDSDGDGRAETVILYDEKGKPRRAEIDTNNDGAVDRWEELRPDGSVASVAYAVRRPGRPDLWEYAGPDGRVVRREIDEDGDGKADRIETTPETAR